MDTKKLQKIFWIMCGAAFLLWVFWDIQDSPGMIHSLLSQLLVPLIAVGMTALVMTIKELQKIAATLKKPVVEKVIYFYVAYTAINILIPFIFPHILVGLALIVLIVTTVTLCKKNFKLTTKQAILYFLAAQLGTYAVIEILGTIFSCIRGL